MNIAMDVFLKAPFLMEKVKLMPDIQKIFNHIGSFVMGRLKPLEDEINKEENAEPDKTKWTIIYLDPPKEDPGRFIGIEGYSDELTKKMIGCFNDMDAKIIRDMVRAIMARGYN